MRSLPVLFVAALAIPAAAQLKVAVQATNDAGIAIDKADNSRVVQNHPANTPFSTYARLYYNETAPYTYLTSYVYPPYSVPSGPTYNRVMLMASALTQKGSKHKSLHTTDAKKGDPGTQKFQISLSSAAPTKVKIDWYAYGYVYDASKVALKFSVASTTKSWNYTSGYNTDSGSLEIPVSGTVVVSCELTGACIPGTGGSGNAYYDGFYGYLNFNFTEVTTGSFTPFGQGCGTGTIGAKGTPTKGSQFTVTLNNAGANQVCALLYGYSKDYYQFIKLPLDLSYMGAKGCFLNVSFTYPWYRQADATGYADGTVYLSPYTSGTYYVQWLLWDPSQPATLPTLTRGAEIKY
ncbi:MAG: hypothetical protein KDC87_15160 [Planctomycetes bacterium]|nr:hypothetical protein [Planctomycetota bacterium]MCB9869279.1 hypothetical protein [Planctomycetota bacterium]